MISLSGERTLGAQPDLLPAARRLRVPTLWVSSDNDGYTTFGEETRRLYRGARWSARCSGPCHRGQTERDEEDEEDGDARLTVLTLCVQ
jgi:pimeloyl-ACP methyl ester carboxylesterase